MRDENTDNIDNNDNTLIAQIWNLHDCFDRILTVNRGRWFKY